MTHRRQASHYRQPFRFRRRRAARPVDRARALWVLQRAIAELDRAMAQATAH